MIYTQGVKKFIKTPKPKNKKNETFSLNPALPFPELTNEDITAALKFASEREAKATVVAS